MNPTEKIHVKALLVLAAVAVSANGDPESATKLLNQATEGVNAEDLLEALPDAIASVNASDIDSLTNEQLAERIAEYKAAQAAEQPADPVAEAADTGVLVAVSNVNMSDAEEQELNNIIGDDGVGEGGEDMGETAEPISTSATVFQSNTPQVDMMDEPVKVELLDPEEREEHEAEHPFSSIDDQIEDEGRLRDGAPFGYLKTRKIRPLPGGAPGVPSPGPMYFGMVCEVEEAEEGVEPKAVASPEPGTVMTELVEELGTAVADSSTGLTVEEL